MIRHPDPPRKTAPRFRRVLEGIAGGFSGLPLRLLLFSALFIAAATLLSAGLTLTGERKEGLAAAAHRFRVIEQRHLSALIHDLEKFDRDSLSRDLSTLLLFPDVTYAEVRNRGECIMSAGIMDKSAGTVVSFPLRHYYEGRSTSLGNLNIIVSHAGARRSVMEKAALILKTQGVVLALFIPFFLFLFHVLVGKNMGRILRWSTDLDPERPVPPLTLPGAAGAPEVGAALASVNTLAGKLERAVEERDLARSLHATLYETPFIGLIRIRISDQKILSASPRALSITAYESVDQMNADGFRLESHILIPPQREELFSLLGRKERVEDFKARFRFRDGVEKVLSLSLTVYISEGYVEGSLLDITRFTAMEEKAALMKKELSRRALYQTAELRTTFADLGESRDPLTEREKAFTLGDLIAAMGVEIKGPIRQAGNQALSIRDLTRIEIDHFPSHSPDADKFREYLAKVEGESEAIIKELNRAGRLTAAFEKLARDQADELLKEFNLKEYMEDVLVGVRQTIRSRKKKFAVTLQCPEGLSIINYPGTLARVVSHLAGNALTHAFRRSARGGAVEVRFSIGEGALLLTVSDNGKGITRMARHLVFQPFYTTKRRKGMRGTGLSFVKSEVENRLGGTITLTSIRGKGSTFHVTVPLIGGPIYRDQSPDAPASSPRRKAI